MTAARTLFAFEPLAQYLDNVGFPTVQRGGFEIIRRDFSHEEREGRIRYEAVSIR